MLNLYRQTCDLFAHNVNPLPTVTSTIIFPYAAETEGGSIFSSFLLIEALLQRGWSAIVASHGQGPARDLAKQRGFPILDLPALGKESEMARGDRFRVGHFLASFGCVRVLHRQTASLVHVNDKRMLRTWMLPAKLTGRPLVAHWRSNYGPSRTVDMGLRLASRVVCVSEYSRSRLPQWAQPKSEVVYNPFEPMLASKRWPEARRRIRTRYDISEDAAVVAYFGTLAARKRPHVLLQILKRLNQTADGRQIVGLVCGAPVEPRDETFYRMLKEEDWTGRLVFPGQVDNVSEWMAAADVMIAPAYREPLARVGIEAQLMGLPAIVSSDGGLAEVVEHDVSGLVIDPDAFEDWVGAVSRVLNDRDLQDRLRVAGLTAAGRFTAARHTDQIVSVYGRLLSTA